MVVATRQWIVRQLSLGEFEARRDVYRHSFWMALKIAALAYAMNLVAHFFLYYFGLLPYDLGDALIIATSLTPPVSFIVAFVAYTVVGFAVHDLAVSRKEMERLSRTDALSGLLNRRAFQDAFDRCTAPVAIVLFDIDRFKLINDTHGHTAGDDVIVEVADRIRASFADIQVCARIGGEEFAVLCCGANAAKLAESTENARRLIAQTPIATKDKSVAVTVSAGIATVGDGRSFSEIFSEADRALYVAKASGRDKVVCFNDIGALRADGKALAAQERGDQGLRKAG